MGTHSRWLDDAELAVLSPGQKIFPCLTHAFAAPTLPWGMEAELIFLGKGLEKDYAGIEACGKIVLREPGGAGAQVEAAEIAERHGAAAQIHISVGHPRAISINRFGRIWGNPNLETIDKIPQSPAISVGNEDSRYLASLVTKGRVRIRLTAEVWRGYKKIRFPIGMISGAKEPERYILFATHYCGWFHGATDNAAANAMMLEMARIFSRYGGRLER